VLTVTAPVQAPGQQPSPGPAWRCAPGRATRWWSTARACPDCPAPVSSSPWQARTEGRRTWSAGRPGTTSRASAQVPARIEPRRA